MNELKKQISMLFNEHRKLWINGVQKAKEESKKLSIGDIMLGDADIQQKIDSQFILFSERLKQVKKGGFFK